jgi:adenylate cyclase
MFTDMVGSTAMAQTHEAEALALRDEQEQIVRPLFAAHHGRAIKSMGDGFLAEFDSALRAVECSIAIQQRLHERNSRAGGTPIQLRIGVHLGDVERRRGDIFGDAVNIASRIEPLAPPGGVCISAQVFDQVHNKVPQRFEKLAPKLLKNLQAPIEVYRLVVPWEGHGPPGPIAARPHLAVLPLANISPDPNDEYFAEGLTEELIVALSRIKDLRVIARTSVGQYKATTKTVAQIGAELGVSSILEGSVRKAGDRLRIALQLIDASSQSHLWANTYDRELRDVFAIQTEVAEKTASALQLQILGPDHGSRGRESTPDLAAYTLYLKGIHAARGSFEGLAESIQFFEEAIRIDPGFPQPHALLAHVLISLAGDARPVGEVAPRAREAIGRALELDPDSSEAHTGRGNLALQIDHEWGVAEAEFRRAIQLNPSNAYAHHWYACLLRTVGRYPEAMKEFRLATELDPLWPTPQVSLWLVQCLAGDFVSATAAAEAARDREPGNPQSHVILGLIYAEAGRRSDVRKEAELSVGPVNRWGEWIRALLWAYAGEPDEARHALEELEETSRTRYVSPAWIAEGYAALGETEKAFDWLGRDHEEGAKSLWFRYQDSAFDSLRNDPRFRSILARHNLPSNVRSVRGVGLGR